MIHYNPATANAELKMLYAGAKELMRIKAETARVLEISDAEDLGTISSMLHSED